MKRNNNIMVVDKDHLQHAVSTVMTETPPRYWYDMLQSFIYMDDLNRVPLTNVCEAMTHVRAPPKFVRDPEFVSALFRFALPMSYILSYIDVMVYEDFKETLCYVMQKEEWDIILSWVSKLVKSPYRMRNMYKFIYSAYTTYMEWANDDISQHDEIRQNIERVLQSARDTYDDLSKQVELYNAKCSALSILHDKYMKPVYDSMEDDVRNGQRKYIKHLQQLAHAKDIVNMYMNLYSIWDSWVDLPDLMSESEEDDDVCIDIMPPSSPHPTQTQKKSLEERISELTVRLHSLQESLRNTRSTK